MEGGGPTRSTCEAIAPTICSRHYVRSGDNVSFCHLVDAVCMPASSVRCTVPDGLGRLSRMRETLLLRVQLLQSVYNASVAHEEATAAVSHTFERGILADSALSLQQVEAMLRYQLVVRNAEAFGWASGPFNLTQIAMHLVYDQLASMERVLHAELTAADERLAALRSGSPPPTPASVWLLPALADVRSRPEVIDGYLRRRSFHVTVAEAALSGSSTAPVEELPPAPLFVSGFNSASTLIKRRQSGEWAIDRNGVRQLRALGTNVIVLFASPAALLLANETLDAEGLQKLQEELRSVSEEGLAAIVHIPSVMPSWALERFPSLGVRDGQHSIAYDVDHPQTMLLMRIFFRQLLPALHPPSGCHPAIVGFQLANEPSLRWTAPGASYSQRERLTCRTRSARSTIFHFVRLSHLTRRRPRWPSRMASSLATLRCSSSSALSTGSRTAGDSSSTLMRSPCSASSSICQRVAPRSLVRRLASARRVT